MSLEDRAAGALLGLALGDACGAPFEGGPLEPITGSILGLGKGSLLRWTDDTQMAVALAESLIACRRCDPDDQARRWAEAFEITRGYGPGTRTLLARIREGMPWREANRLTFPDGSLGNGAAMRAAPLGIVFRADPETLREETRRSSEVTHAHPLGIEGGQLIARAVAMALDGNVDLAGLAAFCRTEEFRARIGTARRLLAEDAEPSVVKKELKTRAQALYSAVTALYAFVRHGADFDGMIRYVIGLGGDTDTIGAMAGAVFGASRGVSALPSELLDRLEERARIESLGRALATL